MYDLYYRENSEGSQPEEEYEANLLRAYRHLDACRLKKRDGNVQHAWIAVFMEKIMTKQAYLEMRLSDAIAEEIEVFVRDGKTVGDSVCDNCGYMIKENQIIQM